MPLDLMMFAAMIGFILLGYPVAFTIAGVATIFAFLGWWLDLFEMRLLGALGQRFFGIMTNPVLTAIPLFLVMGVVLQKSQIAEDLLETMGRMFGRMRGGLALSVVLVGALLAASTGIVGATVVAMGLIALPTMLRNGYNPPFAAGTVCTAGTLGQIIPPSTLLIILAEVMSSAYQQAQFRQGRFTIETISVGQTFAAALLPGLALVAIYLVYVLARAWLRPADAPALADREATPRAAEALRAVVVPIILIVAVLGAILGGIATPTEAASVGAIGAILLSGYRLGAPKWVILSGSFALGLLAIMAGVNPVRLQRLDIGAREYAFGVAYAALALWGGLAILASLLTLARKQLLVPVLSQTMVMSAMIFATILMASFFSLVFVGLGGEHRIAGILQAMPGGPAHLSLPWRSSLFWAFFSISSRSLLSCFRCWCRP